MVNVTLAPWLVLPHYFVARMTPNVGSLPLWRTVLQGVGGLAQRVFAKASPGYTGANGGAMPKFVHGPTTDDGGVVQRLVLSRSCSLVDR